MTVAFSVVIMLALGGARTLVGPLGALVIQGLSIAGQGFALWEPLVAGVLLVLVMTYLPRGTWGTVTAYVRETAARRRKQARSANSHCCPRTDWAAASAACARSMT